MMIWFTVAEKFMLCCALRIEDLYLLVTVRTYYQRTCPWSVFITDDCALLVGDLYEYFEILSYALYSCGIWQIQDLDIWYFICGDTWRIFSIRCQQRWYLSVIPLAVQSTEYVYFIYLQIPNTENSVLKKSKNQIKITNITESASNLINSNRLE